MPQHYLRIVPKPDEKIASILTLVNKSETVHVRGTSDHNYVCGQCAAVLLEAIEENQVRGMVLLCNGCGSYNATP